MTLIQDRQPTALTSNPRLVLIDLQGLVARINLTRRTSEEEITLGAYEPKTHRRKPFINLEGRETDSSGKYILFQEREGGPLARVFERFTGFEMVEPGQRKVGYILTESGGIDTDSNYPGTYESVRLVLTTSLDLTSGVLPRCSVKLSRECGDGYDLRTERRDHTRIWGNFGSRRANLESQVPTSWFDYVHK
ncbi:MAG: hypothetical protein ACP5NS_00760 [Candidatus Pacearchaeota archaeon]